MMPSNITITRDYRVSKALLAPPSPEQVRLFYNSIDPNRKSDDPWHSYSRDRVESFIINYLAGIHVGDKLRVLNAGSGGNSFGDNYKRDYHVDLACRGLRMKRAAVADVQRLPFPDKSFDLTICVGSVINYCDAALAISELSRTLKGSGRLILEFEQSGSLEFLLTPAFRSNAHVIETFYNHHVQYLWVYSERYVENLLDSNGLSVLLTERFHIASPLILRLTQSPKISARFAKADKLLQEINSILKLSCNVIFACEKTA